jgi:hypothetical protein
MAHVVKDRVQETTSTTGTGTLTLGGAVAGYQDFSVIGNGNTTYYAIVGGSEWEVGIGTYTLSGTTLSRDTVLESSNSNALVNFSAGTKNVICTYPAERSVDINSAQTLTNKTIDGANNTLSNIANTSLSNSSITINGSSVSLGGSVSIGTSSNTANTVVSRDANGDFSAGTITANLNGNANTATSANYLNSIGVVGNLNTLLTSGTFGWGNTSTGRPEDYGQGIAVTSTGTSWNQSSNWITQLGFGTSGSSAYFRTAVNSGAWGSWYTFVHSGNISSYAVGIGLGQTWQSPSRAGNTTYQNTSGYPIYVALSAGGGSAQPYVQVSPNNSTWYNVGHMGYQAFNSCSFVVPNGYYYKIAGAPSSLTWSELRQ